MLLYFGGRGGLGGLYLGTLPQEAVLCTSNNSNSIGFEIPHFLSALPTLFLSVPDSAHRLDVSSTL